MIVDEMPRVLQDELDAVWSRLDAAETRAREARRIADRRSTYAMRATWFGIVVAVSYRSWALLLAALTIYPVALALWWRDEKRARRIEDSAKAALWPRIRLLCSALDVVAPRGGVKPPTESAS